MADQIITAAEQYSGIVSGLEFLRAGAALQCQTCSDDQGDPTGDYCCQCCTERDKAPGTYITVRLDGDPSLHAGRVTVTYDRPDAEPELQRVQPTFEATVMATLEQYGITEAVKDVALERMTHESRGWTAEHDAEHGPWNLVLLAEKHLVQSRGNTAPVRSHLVKAASLLVAAIELLDRQDVSVLDAEVRRMDDDTLLPGEADVAEQEGFDSPALRAYVERLAEGGAR
jgi:hypothetical protein